jgi:hypothetical protein
VGKITVTVVDRESTSRRWGHGPGGAPDLATVEISDRCPVCGGPRGVPQWSRFCEDDDWYGVNTWRNPCGHVDQYADVLAEARGRRDAA